MMKGETRIMKKPPNHANEPVSSSWREWLRVILPFAALAALLFGAAWFFIEPAPPRHVVIATGSIYLVADLLRPAGVRRASIL